MTTTSQGDRYPLLEALLSAQGLSMKGMYTYLDVAELFDCSVRALQERIRNGDLKKRNLPGRGRFLPVDLENFLEGSVTPPSQRGRGGNDR